jgi:hypothetical protein
MSEQSAELGRCRAQRSSVESQLDHWRATATRLQAASQAWRSDDANDAGTRDALQAALDAARVQLESLTRERDSMLAELQRVQQAVHMPGEEAQALRAQLASAQQLSSSQAQQLQSARADAAAVRSELDAARADLHAARALACAPDRYAQLTPTLAPTPKRGMPAAATTGHLHGPSPAWSFAADLTCASTHGGGDSPAALKHELAHCREELERARREVAAKQDALQAMWSLCYEAEAQNAAVLNNVHRGSLSGASNVATPPGGARTPSFVTGMSASPLSAASAGQMPSWTRTPQSGTSPGNADELAHSTVRQLQGLLRSSRQRAAAAESRCAALQARLTESQLQLDEATGSHSQATASCAELHELNTALQARLSRAEVAAARHEQEAAACANAQAVTLDLQSRLEQAELAVQAREQELAALKARLQAEQAAAAETAVDAEQMRGWLEAQRTELQALCGFAHGSEARASAQSRSRGQWSQRDAGAEQRQEGSAGASDAYKRQLLLEIEQASKQHEVRLGPDRTSCVACACCL